MNIHDGKNEEKKSTSPEFKQEIAALIGEATSAGKALKNEVLKDKFVTFLTEEVVKPYKDRTSRLKGLRNEANLFKEYAPQAPPEEHGALKEDLEKNFSDKKMAKIVRPELSKEEILALFTEALNEVYPEI